MLRARPVHFTSRIESWKRFVTALGMVQTEDDGGWQVFDSASGRLALHGAEAGSAQDGRTVFAVEVGDLAEFARRTNLSAQEGGQQEQGTQEGGQQGEGTQLAEPVTADHGEACRINAPDGFSFLADKAVHGAQCADADPALAVAGVWYTAEPEAAIRTLLHVGARPRPVPDNDETADFTAKNGGVLLVRPASGPPRSGLGFEYDRGLEPLQDRLTGAGFAATLTEEAFGSTLHVANPDAGSPNAPATVWISQRRPMG
ncbi:VOC family protein [Pseudarthrobacter sp. BRE9]|uniref:VOC family protein n=1 Tax=Pseudarthrobacter sp. BRE9 TaxID=2962582 RepID=UPI002881276A|nr:VOC family protein [Pseudarthrobacter sp. BRE9]MDT0170671.1 VOC family protein [Pseudarthrobacter sp. BRE9]